MSLSRDSRQERKLKIVLRHQFRLRQALERADWEEDVLIKEIEAFKSGGSVLGLPAGAAFDIQVIEHVDPNSPAASTDSDDHTRSEN